MVQLKRILLMVQFFTSLPLKISLEVKEEDFGKGLAFAPLVGLLIGGILAAAYYVFLQVFAGNAAIVLTVITYIILTGGLHLDGLGDTFDGLFSNRSRERILEIMRDSRVGTNAVLAITSILLLNVAALTSIKPDSILKVLLLMPVAGRMGSLAGAAVSRYARSGEGLGKSFIGYCGLRECAVGSVIHVAVFTLAGGMSGAVVAAAVLIFPVLAVKFFSRKISGATGDILGAVCELNQTAFLLIVLVIQRMG